MSLTQGIIVDRFLRTSAPAVSAIGDVIGGYHFSHVAASQAGTAARYDLVLFAKQRVDERVVPWCTFTDSEEGRVGLTPAEAANRCARVRIVTLPCTEIDRAQTDEETSGFLKLVLAGKHEEIVGAHLVGAHAGELLEELVLAMRQPLPLSILLSPLRPYPTFSIGLQQLAFEAYVQGANARCHRTLIQVLLTIRLFLTILLRCSSERKEQV